MRRLGTLTVFAVSAAVGFGFSSLTARSDQFQSARPGENTYRISNVSIGQTQASPESRSVVVHFDMTWVSEREWPGYAECLVEVSDAIGQTIGRLQFETTSILRDPGRGMIDVPLSGPATPDTARLTCARASRPSDDAAYIITGPQISGTEEDPRLHFHVQWEGDEAPRYQKCEAILRKADGSVGKYQFGLSVGPGPATVLLEPSYAGASPLGIACEPFTGEDEWGQ
jgi:hypothetical protein